MRLEFKNKTKANTEIQQWKKGFVTKIMLLTKTGNEISAI